MATKRRYAPAPGVAPEFDEIWARTKEGLTAAGNPEGVDLDEAREKLAENFVKFGGKTYGVGNTDEWTMDLDAPAEAIAREPAVIHIPAPATDPYWWEDPEQAEFIEHHIMARRALGRRVIGGLLITGPAGSAKTMGIPRLIERLNREHGLALRLTKMDCPVVTDPQKWFGRREIDAKGTRYEKSDFILAVERGDVILLDEVKRLHPTIHNPIMSLLAGDESVLLSDLNVTITRHPETVIIATTNEGAAFGGNHRMDYAMDERFPFRVERGFAPEKDEIKILTSHNPGCDPDAASVLVDIARKTRDLFATGDLRAPISTRTLNDAAFLVASGYTERKALEYTALGLYDGNADGSVGAESEREKVKHIIDGRTRR